MSDNKVVIERTFDAAIQSVWDMWAVSENFQKWYGPEGASIPVAKMDVTVGGSRHICMEMNTPNGPMKMWFVGEYLKVDPVTLLSYTEVMSNEAGDMLAPSAMGMPGGDEPMITTITVALEDLGNDRTKMTLTHAGIPADSPGAVGWQMAIDKLATLFT